MKASNAIARVVLFDDELAKPLDGPSVEVCAVAKRDLRAGEVLDDYWMFMTHGEAVNAEEMCERRRLPEGLVEGCKLLRDVANDRGFDLPRCRASGRPDRRSAAAEQYRRFPGESWREELTSTRSSTMPPVSAARFPASVSGA